MPEVWDSGPALQAAKATSLLSVTKTQGLALLREIHPELWRARRHFPEQNRVGREQATLRASVGHTEVDVNDAPECAVLNFGRFPRKRVLLW
jgi:hypothetical protein